MKTTVTLEDDLAAQLASAAQASGVDVHNLVNDLVRQSLRRLIQTNAPAPKPFCQRTHDFGPPLLRSLDQVQHMADALDDEAGLRRGGLVR
jgi:hypothetical protein